ncbi:hypothetical protein B0H13DRAFT_1851515 [Mycena leptocephala]|nr:hypothetical protein B0H13DRAFT_1851515 [Mycena leptocephala]
MSAQFMSDGDCVVQVNQIPTDDDESAFGLFNINRNVFAKHYPGFAKVFQFYDTLPRAWSRGSAYESPIHFSCCTLKEFRILCKILIQSAPDYEIDVGDAAIQARYTDTSWVNGSIFQRGWDVARAREAETRLVGGEATWLFVLDTRCHNVRMMQGSGLEVDNGGRFRTVRIRS